MKTNSQLVEFNSMAKELDEIYHELAGHFGLSDSGLWLLYSMRESEKVCTQKEICEMWSFSKQTINFAMKSLEAKGYIRLEPSAENYKSKWLLLTPAGEIFAKKSIDPILKMERTAFGQLSEEERGMYLELSRKHLSLFREETNKILKSSSEDI